MTKAASIPPTAISRAIVVLLILIVVKVVLVAARGPAPIELDARQYWDLSSQVMAGDPWLIGVPIAYRTPMYPWFLAVIRTLGGPFELPAVVVAQAIAAVASVAFAARLAWLLTESKRAVAVTLSCLLPSISAMTYVPVVLTETLFTTLWMANLVTVATYAKRPTLGSATLAAITYAACLLTRPIVLLAFVPHLLLVWMVTRGRRSSHTTRASGHPLAGAVAGAGAEATPNGNSSGDKTFGSIRGHAVVAIGIVALMVGPWLARNRQLFGETFLTEFLGRNVWIVTFQQGPSVAGFDLPDSPAGDELRRRIEPLSSAPPRDDALPAGDDALPAGDEDWRNTWTVSNQLRRSGLDDAEADRLMKRVAFDAIVDSPWAFSGHAIRRIVNYWRCAATELPEPVAAGIPPAHAGIPPDRARNPPARGGPTWSWRPGWMESWIANRWSRSVTINGLIAAVIASATVAMIVRPSTRPFGVWFGLLFAYVSVITGLVEIPTYRYRLVIEPLAAAAVGSGFDAAFRFSQRRIQIEPVGEHA